MIDNTPRRQDRKRTYLLAEVALSGKLLATMNMATARANPAAANR
jgi:hypothetical protein